MTFSTPIMENSPQAILEAMGVEMRGNIRCARCHRSKTPSKKAPVCTCGHSGAYIVLYWQGKHHRFFRYIVDGEVFDLRRASKQLTEMNLAIDKKRFRPTDWIIENVQARLFGIQLDRWLAQKAGEKDAGEFAPSTLRAYEGYAKNYYRPFFKSMDVQEIDFGYIEEFKDKLAEKGVKIKTRRNILNGLSSLFHWLRRKGIIKAVPPFPAVEGDDSRLMRALTLAEQDEGLQGLSEAHRDVFSFGFEQGLRPGELCALKVKDLDLVKAMVCIQRTYSGAELKETTKAKNKKWMPLSDRALEIARIHAQDKLPEAFLFINPETGKGYRTEYLRRTWRLQSGSDVTLYEAMRHSFCTQLVEDGATEREAQELMRHVERSSTARYIHAGVERHRGRVNRRGKGKVLPMAKSSVIERALNEKKTLHSGPDCV